MADPSAGNHYPVGQNGMRLGPQQRRPSPEQHCSWPTGKTKSASPSCLRRWQQPTCAVKQRGQEPPTGRRLAPLTLRGPATAQERKELKPSVPTARPKPSRALAEDIEQASPELTVGTVAVCYVPGLCYKIRQHVKWLSHVEPSELQSGVPVVVAESSWSECM